MRHEKEVQAGEIEEKLFKREEYLVRELSALIDSHERNIPLLSYLRDSFYQLARFWVFYYNNGDKNGNRPKQELVAYHALALNKIWRELCEGGNLTNIGELSALLKKSNFDRIGLYDYLAFSAIKSNPLIAKQFNEHFGLNQKNFHHTTTY